MKPFTNRRQIGIAARRIAREFRPERIILFGSYARGTAKPDSDVDLLVVARTTRPLSLAGRILWSLAGQFPADILVRTPREMERAELDRDSFITEVLSTGEVLYAARRSRVGAKGRGRLPRRAS